MFIWTQYHEIQGPLFVPPMKYTRIYLIKKYCCACCSLSNAVHNILAVDTTKKNMRSK